MMKKILVVALAMFSMGVAQADEVRYALEVSAPTLNRDVPSASGLAASKNFFYAIGDDAQWLFELDRQFNVTDKQLIKAYPLDANGRIEKSVKPDFEAMAQFRQGKQTWSMVLGSGSKAQVREWGFLLSSDRVTKHERSLVSLYSQLKLASGATELNIEGLAFAANKAYIFNRGNAGANMIYSVKEKELIDYMFGRLETFSKVEFTKVTLPNVSGFEAGLSGGDTWAKNNSLVYTASVEATGDSYNDGAILGSFVGVIPLQDLKHGRTLDLSRSAQPMLNAGRVVITKAESLAITESESDEIKGVIASDNDDGTSEFFRFKLSKDD